jgi:hypothetical protein
MVTNSEDKNPLKTKNGNDSRSRATCVSVDAGICGFTCRIKAWKIDKRAVGLEISESECQQIQQFSEFLSKLTLKGLFMPVTRNPVYLAAEQSGCHPSCPIPAAVLKAAEVAMEMALPRDAFIRFEQCLREKN